MALHIQTGKTLEYKAPKPQKLKLVKHSSCQVFVPIRQSVRGSQTCTQMENGILFLLRGKPVEVYLCHTSKLCRPLQPGKEGGKDKGTIWLPLLAPVL